MIIRWPYFVRWLQTQASGETDSADQAAARMVALAANAGTAQAFGEALKTQGIIQASWTDDAELWEFLRAATPPELRIALAASRGLR